MTKNTVRTKALRQIEDCINGRLYHVNDDGQLIMTHPEKSSRSEIELLKILFQKEAQYLAHRLAES
jgi:hypothetical protein